MSRALVLLSLAFVACPKNTASVATSPDAPAEDVSPELNEDAVAGIESADLRQLLHDHWEHTMSVNPTWATSLGDHRFDDQLGDLTIAAAERDRAATQAFLERARTVDAQTLSDSDRTTLALFIEDLEYSVASEVCHFEQWSLSPRSNAAVFYNDLPDIHPVDTPARRSDLVARYTQLPRTVDEHIAQLRMGLDAGRVANADSVGLVIEQIERELAKPTTDWALASVASDGDEVFRESVMTALEAYRTSLRTYLIVLTDEVLPQARGEDAVGLGALPDGPACYEARVASFTTLDRSADAIHQLGLDEMARIHAEFQDLGESVFGTRDLTQIFDHLRTDEALLFDTSEEVQAMAEQALADARAAIPQAFGRLPQAEAVVAPVPDNEAPYTTIAYYREPSPDGGRPGTYYVNTYAPETRPRHEARVLAYHESIPGHHLQIAIAQELPDLPAFRRHMGMTAFVEGWALYTERLSDELGLYPEDVDRLGMLSFDAWRAARLVVDTGLHSKGWTRDQAEQYMIDNTPLATNNIANEVDRYITWPGQALAYKTGQIEIRTLRREAEAALGDDFDLSAFHDVVLGGGAVSMPELRRRVEQWVAQHE